MKRVFGCVLVATLLVSGTAFADALDGRQDAHPRLIEDIRGGLELGWKGGS